MLAKVTMIIGRDRFRTKPILIGKVVNVIECTMVYCSSPSTSLMLLYFCHCQLALYPTAEMSELAYV